MARISGIDLPKDKKVEIGLTYIFGIGRSSALEILEKAGIDVALRIRDLTDADVNKLRQVIEKEYRVEGALRTMREAGVAVASLEVAEPELEEVFVKIMRREEARAR